MSLQQEESKICHRCNKTRPVNEFPTRSKGVIPNRRRVCIDCYKQRRRELWKIHDQKRNQTRRDKWRNDPEHRAKNKIATKKYRDNNREALRIKYVLKHKQIRSEVITKYGGKCVCCQESTPEFLAIDHINNDGNIERKNLSASMLIYKLWKSPTIIDKYQLLCHNCNAAKAFHGQCPHQRDKLKTIMVLN